MAVITTPRRTHGLGGVPGFAAVMEKARAEARLAKESEARIELAKNQDRRAEATHKIGLANNARQWGMEDEEHETQLDLTESEIADRVSSTLARDLTRDEAKFSWDTKRGQEVLNMVWRQDQRLHEQGASKATRQYEASELIKRYEARPSVKEDERMRAILGSYLHSLEEGEVTDLFNTHLTATRRKELHQNRSDLHLERNLTPDQSRRLALFRMQDKQSGVMRVMTVLYQALENPDADPSLTLTELGMTSEELSKLPATVQGTVLKTQAEGGWKDKASKEKELRAAIMELGSSWIKLFDDISKNPSRSVEQKFFPGGIEGDPEARSYVNETAGAVTDSQTPIEKEVGKKIEEVRAQRDESLHRLITDYNEMMPADEQSDRARKRIITVNKELDTLLEEKISQEGLTGWKDIEKGGFKTGYEALTYSSPSVEWSFPAQKRLEQLQKKYENELPEFIWKAWWEKVDNRMTKEKKAYLGRKGRYEGDTKLPFETGGEKAKRMQYGQYGGMSVKPPFDAISGGINAANKFNRSLVENLVMPTPGVSADNVLRSDVLSPNFAREVFAGDPENWNYNLKGEATSKRINAVTAYRAKNKLSANKFLRTAVSMQAPLASSIKDFLTTLGKNVGKDVRKKFQYNPDRLTVDRVLRTPGTLAPELLKQARRVIHPATSGGRGHSHTTSVQPKPSKQRK